MKTYKYLFLLCLLALQSVSFLDAQDTMSQPVDIGSKTSSFTYTNTKNTANFNNDYGQGSNDVFYKFTLTQTMDVKISHCDSEMWDTYVHILDVNGNLLNENDDDWEYEYCVNPMNSYLNMSSLPAGTYYVVSEGYSQNGNITTTIQGISPMDVYSQDIGSKASSFTFTDTKNTVNYSNNYIGQESNDLFYKFTLARPMTLYISHCGSALQDTYLHLLDESGNLIVENDDDWQYDYCEGSILNSFLLMPNLNAGTYYVVSEGYGEDNGSITTTVQGVRPNSSTLQNAGLDPSTDQNYILTITPTEATTDVNTLSSTQSIQNLQYFDGLGRPIQTVQRKITPQFKDMVSTIEYDGVGREFIQWLPTPIADNQGAFVNLNDISNLARSVYADSRPFNETIFESSPLNRVIGQKGAGAAWNTHPNNVSYQTNSSDVENYIVNSSNILERSSNYTSGMLYETTNTDEDGKNVTEYKNMLGQVIMKQSSTDVQTYYVYNDLGQLSYVIPPLLADDFKILTENTVINDDNVNLRKYGYLYKYDERGNCIYKRLPGCTPIYMVYDKADRLVLSQDGNQRIKSTREWTATKYDVFGRVIYMGTMSRTETDSTTNYKSIRDIFVTELVVDGYMANNFGSCTPLTENFYDNYSFLTPQSTLNFVSELGFDAQHTSAKGMQTGSRVYVLGNQNQFTTTVMYYDYRGRVVQTRSSNHLGGLDLLYNHYTFSGQVLQSLKKHTATGQTEITELYTNTYDHAGRLITTYYKINTKDPVLLVNNTYDELGRLIQKKRHNDTDLEEFDYNIRNWSTRITSGTGSNKFEEKLYYSSNPANSTPCFDGNISYSTWTYDSAIKGYAYTYDELNRLLDATFKQGTSTQGNGFFDEKFTYDKMGNIKTLMRKKDNQLIDDLKMTYLNNNQSNQLQSIYDEAGTRGIYDVKEYQNKINSTTEMAYDVNGNLTKDLDRDIVTIKYNLLNLPEIIQFKNGNQIRNTYDASGQKLKTRNYTVYHNIQPIVAENTIIDVMTNDEVYVDGTDYIGNAEYHYDAEYFGGEFSWEQLYLTNLYNPEGYCQNLSYLILNYYRRDHLGNNREVWRAPYKVGSTNYAATTIQRTQYYPSGLPWASNSGDNPWMQNKKYNGKEFVEMHGLDEYDYHARGMYPALMRFTTQDPLLEDYPEISPYAYCLNNPLRYNDPSGMSPNDSTNTVVLDDLVVLAKKVVATTLAYFYYANTLVGERVNRAFGYTNESSQSNFMTGLNTNMMILSVASSASKIKPEASSNNKNQSLKSLFKSGKKVKASELVKYAESQGWTMKRNPNGPIKYFDQNGVERLTIKKGSIRTPGSNYPHVAAKNASNVRIDPRTEFPVSRNSSGPIGNHTEIEYDL